jgi:hypothetical protein
MKRTLSIAFSIVTLAFLALATQARIVQGSALGQRSAHAANDAMGPVMMVSQHAWQGYYDSHKDIYLSTDISSKAQAAMMHINYSAAIGTIHTTPEIYLVKGQMAANQIAVFGSQPGESNYSPLWHEVDVTWKAGAKPVLLTSDNQILALAKKGKLTTKTTMVILNCPIVKVGK